MTSNLHSSPHRRIAAWLLGCCALVVVILVIGGITRLTQSGLSITEWEPVRGIIPPLTNEGWLHYFELYRQSPEYEHFNSGMTLQEFRGIFWWEYLHRVVARIFGLALLLPMAYFALRRWLRGWDLIRAAGLLVLLGLQASVGWVMVQSGLGDKPYVSHLRLSIHLGLAFILFGAMLWWALSLLRPSPARPAGREARLFYASVAMTVLIFVQSMWGAFVAGLHAGKIVNTFPKMGDHWISPQIGKLSPIWVDVTSNQFTVQFIHRTTGMVIVVAAFLLFLWTRREGAGPEMRFMGTALFAGVLLQFALGVATLVMAVPIALGVLHQALALLLFGLALAMVHGARLKSRR